LFNEGYYATDGDKLIRKDLCLEAMRLIRGIAEIQEIRNGDTYALLALMCFHSARFEARTDSAGEIIELEMQDRTTWDKDLISLGMQYLKQAKEFNKISRFLLEAAITSIHCTAKTFIETKWDIINGLYDQLCKIYSSPFNDLNKAVTVFYLKGGPAALHVLEVSVHLNWLKNYYLYYAFLGKVFQSEGKIAEAKVQYEKAMNLTKLTAEQNFLRRKIETC
jgi:RNA polymerase sigma-70 factor (ECF subfamily)